MQVTRVLLVEGDETFSQEIVSHLEEIGFTCLAIHDPTQIDESIKTFDPHIIMLDFVFDSEYVGTSLASLLRESSIVPIVFMTANVNAEKLGLASKIENCTCLMKPLNYKELHATIHFMQGQTERYRQARSEAERQQAQLRGLAEANVRMALLTDLILELKEIENVFYQNEDISLLYSKLLESLVLVTESTCGYVLLDFDNGDDEVIMAEGHSQDVDCYQLIPSSFIRSISSENIVRTSFIPQQVDKQTVPGQSRICVMSGAITVKDSSSAIICLAKNRPDEEYSISDQNILQIFISEIESVLERYYLLKRSQKEHAELEQEKKNHVEVIKKLHEAQDQLLQSEKMASIGQLAAGIAHEINNPVGYISSNLGTLRLYVEQLLELLEVYESAREQIVTDDVSNRLNEIRKRIEVKFLVDDLKDLLAESSEGLDRVKKIVQDLKDFSHVDEAERQWVDLRSGLDSTLNIVNNELKYKAEVIRKYNDIPQIECIISQINQVFMNILVNAAHAIEKNGKIIITTDHDADWMWVDIEDTGRGMDEVTRKRIFDPFFTTKPVGKGTGLGLSLSYSIIQKHHGDIEVKSEPGKGTHFRIKLPLSQPDTEADQSG